MAHSLVNSETPVLCPDTLLKVCIKRMNRSVWYYICRYFLLHDDFQGRYSMSSLQKFSAGVQLELYPEEPTGEFTCLWRIKPIKLSKILSQDSFQMEIPSATKSSWAQYAWQGPSMFFYRELCPNCTWSFRQWLRSVYFCLLPCLNEKNWSPFYVFAIQYTEIWFSEETLLPNNF